MLKFEPIVHTAVTSVTTGSSGLMVELRSTAEPNLSCPYCGFERVRNGTRRLSFRDVPANGQPITIEWRRQKFICLRCRRSSHDAHPAFDKRHAVTKRFVDWVSDQGRKVTFASLSKLSCVDEKTVRRIFAEANEGGIVSVRGGLLGIELIRVAGRQYPALIDIQERTIADVFSSETALEDRLAIARLSNECLYSIATLVRDINLPDRIKVWFSPTTEDVISRPSLHRSAVAALEAEIEPLFAELRTDENRSTNFDLALFRKRELDLGRTARIRLARWQQHFTRLYRIYRLKEDFLNLWRFDANPDEKYWQLWKRLAADLGLSLREFVDRVDSNIAAITAYPDHRASCQLYPSLLARAENIEKSGTHSFAASRAILLRKMGKKN